MTNPTTIKIKLAPSLGDEIEQTLHDRHDYDYAPGDADVLAAFDAGRRVGRYWAIEIPTQALPCLVEWCEHIEEQEEYRIDVDEFWDNSERIATYARHKAAKNAAKRLAALIDPATLT